MTQENARWHARPYAMTALLLLAAYCSCAASAELASKTLIVTSESLADDGQVKPGATISDIRIDNRDVFDTDDADESGVLYRLANALHIQTRPDVIRHQLLLQEGDGYDERMLEESERILRTNRYLSKADIRTVRVAPDTVDIEVVTEDTWSLAPSLSFSRKGGENAGGFEISDSNILGSGSEIRMGYKSGIERDEVFFGYHDPQLGASRTALAIGFADASDGQQHEFVVRRPFYSLDARRAAGLSVRGFDQVDSLYSLGEVDRRFEHSAEHVELFYGWSDGLKNGYAGRWTTGVAFDRHRISPLEASASTGLGSRRDLYPFIGYERIEDRYETTRNADNLQVVEDRHIGTRLAGRVGYSSAGWGSADAWLASFSARRGFKVFGGDTVLASFNSVGRFAAGLPTQSLLDGSIRYFHRQSSKRLLYAGLSVRAGQHLDPDAQLTLGGETGLRGYPIRYLNGDVVSLVTLEQRFYTDWYPFHLFRVGAAVFADAGKVLRSSAGEPAFTGWHRDVGVGLRIGSPRSSSGRMLHVDYACPLDARSGEEQCQFVIETRHTF